MVLIFGFFFAFAFFVFVELRLMVLHPVKTIGYTVRDIYRYFHDRSYDRYDGGKLDCYSAHFGGGKSLSGVHEVLWTYHRYNNKRIYDRQRKKWVLQKIYILSNIDFVSVPSEPLIGLHQMVNYAELNKKIDEENDTRSCILVLLDEASSQLNSRAFKNNFSPDVINSLITCRHYHLSFFYCSQKFHLTDSLLRSVTQRVIWCEKKWRFMVLRYYDADEMENATNPLMVKPIKTTGFFITDADFDAYDTLATVEMLVKDTKAGKMLSEAEILALRGNMNPDSDNIMKPSRKLRKARKRA